MKTHYDTMVVEASLIDAPWTRDDKYPQLIVELNGGSSVDLDQPTEDVEDISLIDPDSLIQHPFVSDGQRYHGSWGSDGSTLSLVIDIAQSLGSAALYDGIRRLINEYRTAH